MRARPILFSGPMVRALLAGAKTQTRRVAKAFLDRPDLDGILARYPRQKGCPYGVPGDLLWVRESGNWRGPMKDHIGGGQLGILAYAADPDSDFSFFGGKKRPSIHMPRWASRLTLEITDVRVERLQDISEEDAMAEGIHAETVIVDAHCNGGLHQEVTARRFFFDGGSDGGFEDGASAYFALWNSINGPDADFANPWVWAVSFRCINKNVNEVINV